MALLSLERVCGFVGHLADTGGPDVLDAEELTRWADRISEAVEGLVKLAAVYDALRIATLVTCVAWLNWSIVLLEEGNDDTRDANLLAASRWVAVYQNLSD